MRLDKKEGKGRTLSIASTGDLFKASAVILKHRDSPLLEYLDEPLGKTEGKPQEHVLVIKSGSYIVFAGRQNLS